MVSTSFSTVSGVPTRDLSGGPGQPPPLTRRFSWKYLAVAVSALLTFVAVAAALKSQSQTVEVVMALSDLEAGHRLTVQDVRVVTLPASSPVAPGVLRPAEIDGRMIVASRIPRDAPVVRSQIRFVAAPHHLRAMSVPVAVEHAAGGSLVDGDRVDVIDAAEQATYVVHNAEVLAVRRPSSAGLGESGGYALTLAVDANEALALAAAISGGRIEVVRSTGAVPIDPATLGPPPPRQRQPVNPSGAPNNRTSVTSTTTTRQQNP